MKLIFVMFALYTDRCSVIEPGPVSTSFVANAQMTESDTHPEEVDDETKQLLNNCIKKMRGAFSTMVQTPDEIAQVILAALDAERPHFRYQTNKNYASSAANKLVDITGRLMLLPIQLVLLYALKCHYGNSFSWRTPFVFVFA